jgi:hypothetical protein
VHGRWFAGLGALLVLALAVVHLPARPAAAAPTGASSASAALAADLCSVEEWKSNPARCVEALPDIAAARAQCLEAPSPDPPDSGLGGWFAERPAQSAQSGVVGRYTLYGYAGYSYTTYDIGCAQTLMHPDYKFENTVANGEFLAAVAIIGASNALRERAWDPGVMWGWADPLVEQATKSVYSRVFTVFGAITLAIVGIYLLWRSRQAEMSVAATTAGWAMLVMVAVTAIAAWPVFSAHLADQALVTSLDAVQGAVGPPEKSVPADECPFTNADACIDHRPPALRASDTAVDTMLYRNWLRGTLGSADSLTAQKYGLALYEARTFTWAEVATARSDPATRDLMIQRKANEWMKIAEQIKIEDPEAYQYLQGTRGMERIGAGLVALLSSLMFALFDLTASLLVLLGFLIFRWAVIAAPIIGTVGLLRPASAGFRRLVNSVVAALFNVVVFGTGSAIYLYAVDLIMNTPTIPGWLQVVLVLLCGVVGWMLLRPYRRITQLGGKDPLAAIAAGGLFDRRQARLEQSATAAAAAVRQEAMATPPAVGTPPARVEVRTDGAPDFGPPAPTVPAQATPGRRAVISDGWSEPVEPEPGYALYRPGHPSDSADVAARAARAEARPEG